MMSVLASLPTDITLQRVLGPEDTAAFLGLSISQLRCMRAEMVLPRPIHFSERRYGWRIGDLLDWLNDGAPSKLERNFADLVKQFPDTFYQGDQAEGTATIAQRVKMRVDQ